MNNENRCKNEHYFQHNCGHNTQRRGPSSYAMHNPELVFSKLELKEGDSFLDLGCGAGDYSIQASKIVGDSGAVFALDIREAALCGLIKEAASQNLKNIRAEVSNINNRLPIKDDSIDVCFIATVLHTLDLVKDGEKIYNEIRRVLKPDGRLAIIECKKEDMPFGPPTNMRNSPEELEAVLTQCGFEKLNYVDLGYNYMIQFGVK